MSSTALAPPATPPKWYTVYHGDKECKLFKALARGKSTSGKALEWRTTAGLAKATGLTTKVIEAIIAKYLPSSVIEQHSKEPFKFRYWENATKKKSSKGTISDDNKKRRIDESLEDDDDA